MRAADGYNVEVNQRGHGLRSPTALISLNASIFSPLVMECVRCALESKTKAALHVFILTVLCNSSFQRQERARWASEGLINQFIPMFPAGSRNSQIGGGPEMLLWTGISEDAT